MCDNCEFRKKFFFQSINLLRHTYSLNVPNFFRISFKQVTVHALFWYLINILITFTSKQLRNLVIVITDVRHTDPCVEVILRVIVAVIVPVRVLAHAVPLPLDSREKFPHLFHVLQVPNSI